MHNPSLNEERQARIAQVSRAPITTSPVKSSQIAEIGHDRETNTLAIRFQPRAGEAQGSLYHYGNVTTDMHQQLVGAESVGSFFHGVIKPNSAQYPYVRIDEKAADEQQAA